MLDQNLLTLLSVLISAIGIVGALGGVYLGSKLNSRYMMEADKKKRNIETIEEIYSLVLQVNKWMMKAIGQIPTAKQMEHYQYDLTVFNLEEKIQVEDRINTLVRLYLPHLNRLTEQLFIASASLRDTIYHWLYFIANKGNIEEEKAIEEEFSQRSNQYAKSYADVLSALEKLVK